MGVPTLFLSILKNKYYKMCECDFDNIFLGIMTIISGLIVFVDLKVLEKMFEEYFMMSHYLDSVTYNQCYKP